MEYKGKEIVLKELSNWRPSEESKVFMWFNNSVVISQKVYDELLEFTKEYQVIHVEWDYQRIPLDEGGTLDDELVNVFTLGIKRNNK